jgi:hypothetical protein
LGNLLKLPNALFIYFLKEEEPCFFLPEKKKSPVGHHNVKLLFGCPGLQVALRGVGTAERHEASQSGACVACADYCAAPFTHPLSGGG